MTKRHKETRMTLPNCGGFIRCDAAIKALIFAMNTTRGLETYNSCQGGKGARDGDAYVQYGGQDAALFTRILLNEMLKAPTALLGGLRFVHDNGFENHGWPGCTACYWLPYDYKKVLQLVKAAVARLSR